MHKCPEAHAFLFVLLSFAEFKMPIIEPYNFQEKLSNHYLYLLTRLAIFDCFPKPYATCHAHIGSSHDSYICHSKSYSPWQELPRWPYRHFMILENVFPQWQVSKWLKVIEFVNHFWDRWETIWHNNTKWDVCNTTYIAIVICAHVVRDHVF